MAQERGASRQHRICRVYRNRRRNRAFRRRQHLRHAGFRPLAGRLKMDFAELAALAGGHAEARAIQTALKLRVFDVLERAALDADALARATGTNRRAVAILADAMVSLGLLEKRE